MNLDMATNSQKQKGPVWKGLGWTFVHDADDNIFVSRNGKRLQIKDCTLPRVVDVEVASEDALSKTFLDIPLFDAIVVIFADNRRVVLRVSNFKSSPGDFTSSFKNIKTGEQFVEMFHKVTTSVANTESKESEESTQLTSDELDLIEIDTEESTDSQQIPKPSLTSSGKMYIPPLMSTLSIKPSKSLQEEREINGIDKKILEGTYSIKLSQILDAHEGIRFRDVDQVFVNQIKDDIDMARLTTPQPLALLVTSKDFDPKNPDTGTAQFVCLGGNHLRTAYQLSGIQVADAKIYFNLTDEECLLVSKMHNDVGHYVKKMTNFDLILLLRRQLSPSTEERVKDLVLIKAWRNKISKILPKDKNIKSIQPLLNIAMARKSVFDKVIRIFKMFSTHELKDQKERKSSAVKVTPMNSTSAWKAMMTIDDDTIDNLLGHVTNREMSLEEFQKKCEEIKKYRLLQRQLIKSTDMAWENIILHFFDGSDAEAESSLHPFLGMSDSPEFEAFIRKLIFKKGEVESKMVAVKEVKAADFVYIAEDEVKEDIIRRLHSKNIENATNKYTMVSFGNLDVADKVAEFSHNQIAITFQQKKGSENHFTDLRVLNVAQFGTKTVTSLPGTRANQLFTLKDNNLLPIFELFCTADTKHLREETARMNKTNIVICTPGRLLQHMDETFNFTADSLKILVLDEADRILDLGFAQSMNAIIENLPAERQTLLFSATQTKSVKDLARLSLSNPMYVSVHENAVHSTPTQLEQSYIVCELHDKMNILWSFVKNHLKSKVLVFMSSCKQVKYIFECFRRLRPGVTVLGLHGAMKQLKRVAAYNEFCRKKHAVLFATDIAARGLDFPAVNWVVQMDCPEDANTYIHRAGRTARYEKGGEALLLLLPSEEEAMAQHLHDKKIPVEKIKVNPKKLFSIQPKLEANLAADPSLKEMAQRAFLGYLRSIFLMSDKKVFNIHKVDIEEYSKSLGLAIPPKVRFLKREQKRLEEKAAKNKKSVTQKVPSESESEELSESESRLHPEVASGSDSENESVESDSEQVDSDDNEISDQSESESKSHDPGANKNKPEEGVNFNVDDDDDDLFTVKRVELEDDSDKDDTKNSKKKEKPTTKAAIAKKLHKKKLTVNTKIQFDDEGQAIEDKLKKPTVKTTFDDDEYEGGINIQVAKQRMMEEDKFDKQLFRERIKQKHKEERLKKKEQLREKKKKKDSEDEDEGVEFEGTVDTDQIIAELPDPDKYYGKEEDSDESGEEEDDNESEDESPAKKKPRKDSYESENSEMDENSDSDNDDDDNDNENSDEENDSNSDDVTMDTGLSIEGDEELALRLLKR